jgi:hypothetical protein
LIPYQDTGVFRCSLHLDDAAFETDHGGMRAVFCPQFEKDVPDLAFHRLFAYTGG